MDNDPIILDIIAIGDDMLLPKRIENRFNRLTGVLQKMPTWNQPVDINRSQTESELRSLEEYINKLPDGDEKTEFLERARELKNAFERFLLPREFEKLHKRMQTIKLRIITALSALNGSGGFYFTGSRRLQELLEDMDRVGLPDDVVAEYRKQVLDHLHMIDRLKDMQATLNKNGDNEVVEHDYQI